MRQLFKIMREQLMRGESLVFVSITASSGSVPRGAGAHMLVSNKGRISGTIGGGEVENRAQEIALSVLSSGCSCDSSFTLTANDSHNLGMICGGSCTVFFHYMDAFDKEMIALCEEVARHFEDGLDLWLVSELSRDGRLSITDRKSSVLEGYLSRQPRQVTLDKRELFLEQICTSDRVYIFGGGHVAQELVPVLAHVGFRCIIMEDREAFAKKELFPMADKIILGDFNHIEESINIREDDYVCVMTRGHSYDTVLQAQILKHKPYYCGVIGSRSKAAGVRKVLKEDYGLTEDELSLITTPIGLPIKGVTPAEIAISIAAQMILLRAEK